MVDEVVADIVPDPYATITQLIEVSKEGRVHLVKKSDFYAPPGVCLICREPPGEVRSLVDFGLSIPKHGKLYICNLCFAEVALVFGYIKVEGSQLQKAEQEILKLHNDKDMLKKAILNYEGLIESINKFYERRNAVRNSSSDDVIVDDEGHEQIIANGKASEERGTESVESITEHDTESGSTDVRRAATVDELDDLLEF